MGKWYGIARQPMASDMSLDGPVGVGVCQCYGIE